MKALWQWLRCRLGAHPTERLWLAGPSEVVCTACGGAAQLDVPACRVCGCTDDWACPGGCAWVTADLCSACIPDEAPQ